MLLHVKLLTIRSTLKVFYRFLLLRDGVYIDHAKSHIFDLHINPSQMTSRMVPFLKVTGGGQGSFLHVTLWWKFPSQGSQCFLWNKDILPYEKNIAIRIFGPLHFPIVKFHEKWPLKSAIWSCKIKIICLGGLKLHKKVKSN